MLNESNVGVVAPGPPEGERSAPSGAPGAAAEVKRWSVGRKKGVVLRLMRENALRSPHRRPQGASVRHDGTITTDRPNDMWGTDGIRIETVDEEASRTVIEASRTVTAPSFKDSHRNGLKAGLKKHRA